MSDSYRLEQMFDQQRHFINLLIEKRGHPDIPLDLSKKDSQLFLKHQAHECMHELFEATMHLKNSKTHRATDLPDFDHAAYKEELSDVLHYLIGIMVCSGISADEIYETYVKKGGINVARIQNGY